VANRIGEEKKLDDDEISWMTKEFAGNGCRGWKMAEGVVSVVIVVQRSTRDKNCWMSWTMGRDDAAGLVRYADSSANLRVFLLTG
jgi:hypothetical protein